MLAKLCRSGQFWADKKEIWDDGQLQAIHMDASWAGLQKVVRVHPHNSAAPLEANAEFGYRSGHEVLQLEGTAEGKQEGVSVKGQISRAAPAAI